MMAPDSNANSLDPHQVQSSNISIFYYQRLNDREVAFLLA